MRTVTASSTDQVFELPECGIQHPYERADTLLVFPHKYLLQVPPDQPSMKL